MIKQWSVEGGGAAQYYYPELGEGHMRSAGDLWWFGAKSIRAMSRILKTPMHERCLVNNIFSKRNREFLLLLKRTIYKRVVVTVSS